MWPGQCLALRCGEVVHRERSEFQDVLVMDTPAFGRVLCLDGVIQCTERDEHAYQEMLSHSALCCHPNPKKVLVIGGGDGGILREIAKHSSVEAIHICEIDEEVINVSREHMPF